MGDDIGERGEDVVQEGTRDHRWAGGAVLFIMGILGISGSTFVGYMMLGSGMMYATGFVLLYYVITGVFVLVMGAGALIVHNAVKDTEPGGRMVAGVVFTVIGLLGASASTFVGYQMLGAGMMQAGHGFSALYYFLTVVFIGITLFGLYVVYSAVK